MNSYITKKEIRQYCVTEKTQDYVA